MIISWLVWTEMKCTVHVALSKRSTNQLKPVQQSRQQLLRAYYPNKYTVQAADEACEKRSLTRMQMWTHFYSKDNDIPFFRDETLRLTIYSWKNNSNATAKNSQFF